MISYSSIVRRLGNWRAKKHRSSKCGFVWRSDDRKFEGWAWDPSNPTSTVEVCIYVNDRRIGSLIAEHPIFDNSAPFEASFRGFDYSLPNYYCEKILHLAFKSSSGQELLGSPFVIEPRSANARGDMFSLADIKMETMQVDRVLKRTSFKIDTTTIFYSLNKTQIVESDYPFNTSLPVLGSARAHKAYRPWLPYAVFFKDVFVDLDQGTIFLSDSRIWQSSLYLRNSVIIEDSRRRIAAGDIDGELRETYTLFFTGMAWNYFHWHLDCLAGWHGARTMTSADLPSVAPPLSVVQGRSFALLAGAPPLEKNGLVFCKGIIVGSAFDGRGIFPDRNALEMFDYIKKSSLSTKSIFGQFLFISRKDAKHRTLSNEDELFDKLESIGFERVFLSSMTYDDQINSFRHAKCIVASHGAGLTNIGFCDPGCHIFEIIPVSYVNGCFRFLAALKNLAHSWFPTSNEDPFTVNVEDFMNFLRLNFAI